MPEVRIVLYTIHYDYSGSDYERDSFSLIDSISDWETITNQELDLLNRYLDKEDFGGYYPMVLVKDEVPVINRINNIKSYVKKLEEKYRKQQEQRDKEAAAKKEKAAAKKAEKERKMLEALKAKYGDGGETE
jgi:hypothetical protein